ncbi:hypothetical protein BSZ39_01225 [Bowdeniella nasicola]|uniref:Uncharacterized protein n=1 Tax=Bowdeniella nasicola TaxID=208480 RepID=A0A1Q5Q5C3_9ACTO|nr:hypothetical protein BSZ39_01225 [Bowdeniella nasicola]
MVGAERAVSESISNDSPSEPLAYQVSRESCPSGLTFFASPLASSSARWYDTELTGLSTAFARSETRAAGSSPL